MTICVSEIASAVKLLGNVKAAFRSWSAAGCLLVAGCATNGGEETAPALVARAGTPAASASAALGSTEYPRGTWRTDPDSLWSVVVSASQILVAYKGAAIEPENAWSAKTAPQRTREAARALAVQLAKDLHARPEAFESLVKSHSDEPESRARGGYMGAWRAAKIPTLVLDAYATLKENEISHAFESQYGFHVIKRVPLPADKTVAADEIAIAHNQSPVQPWLRPDRQNTRTREEARELADRVATMAQSDPASFERLVDQYSDGLSAIVSGDRGTWPWYEPSVNPAAFAAVASVPIGQVTGVVEGAGLFRIFRRKPAHPPVWLNTEEVVITHAASIVGMGGSASKRSRKEALALAKRVLRELKQTPSRFASLRDKYCDHVRCREPIRLWMPGSGIAGFDTAVASLAVGQLADTPLETPYGFHIVRRIELPAAPSLPENEHLVFEVPNPGPRNVDFFFERAPSDVLAEATLAFKPEAIRGLALSREKAEAFGTVLDELASALRREPSAQRAALRTSTKEALIRVLGEADYAKYCRLRDEWVRREQKKL